MDQSGPFDRIFVGTGIVSVLEAIHEDSVGRSVLMIDDHSTVGGAWAPWNLFGFSDVENAVHYFLPQRDAMTFMRNVLGWPIARSPGKYLLFPPNAGTKRRVPFDSGVGRLRARLARESGRSALVLARILAYWGIESLARGSWRSHYVEGGTPEMFRRLTDLLRRSRVRLLLSTDVMQIDIYRRGDIVHVGTSAGVITCRTICLTHGSVVRRLTVDSVPIEVPHQRERRPQVHLLVHDSARGEILEGIFVNDPLVKYVHDVTRFARPERPMSEPVKLLVLALHPDAEERVGIFDEILHRLRDAGVVGGAATLIAHHWWDSYLPPLSSETLFSLRDELGPLVSILETENLTAAIAKHAPRWASVLPSVPRATSTQHERTIVTRPTTASRRRRD